MHAELLSIPPREVLHFLGWRGAPLQDELLRQIHSLSRDVMEGVQPRMQIRRFLIRETGELSDTSFCPAGGDVRNMLASCHEAVLLAATLGIQSERMLLRAKAKDASQALLLDAVLSAAIEAVCDQAENRLREELSPQGLYLTDRFSPGYGDMPLEQTKEICLLLQADRTIGLTVSKTGIMIPRKSVTAIMGISHAPVRRRVRGCAGCAMRKSCMLSDENDR